MPESRPERLAMQRPLPIERVTEKYPWALGWDESVSAAGAPCRPGNSESWGMSHALY